MRQIECEFEAEVLAAVLHSQWPELVEAQLRVHVSNCAICSDVVEVAVAIDVARAVTPDTRILPDSGRVWWIAQMRARREATEAAGRPITVVQVLAFACAMGLLGACFGATSTWFQSALRSLGAGTLLPSATALLAEHVVLATGMAALAFLVPAAFYLATRRD